MFPQAVQNICTWVQHSNRQQHMFLQYVSVYSLMLTALETTLYRQQYQRIGQLPVGYSTPNGKKASHDEFSMDDPIDKY